MTGHGPDAADHAHDEPSTGVGAHTHTHDPEGHIAAAETDFEHFRRKRLESRVLHFVRRGIVTFADLLRADSPAELPAWKDRVWKDADGPIRHVEDQLDELVRGIATVTVPHRVAAPVAIDETRKERDYDAFFRIAERGLGSGTLEERLERLDATEGLDEDALAALVTAESLVGAALVPTPEQ